MKCIKLAAACLIALGSASRVAAEAVLDPPHPHVGANIVTWVSPTHAIGDAHDIGIHQHQHRTNHNPGQGVYVEGGNGGVPGNGYQAYVASPSPEWVWVGRTLVSTGNLPAPPPAHPPGYSAHGQLPTEWAHGHQGHSPNGSNVQPPARYHVHTAVANVPNCADDGICQAEADAWNANALTLAFNAFNGIGANPGWLDIGNASGNANWPATDNTTVPGTGVPWHSAVNWVAVDTEPHELHFRYGESGAKAITKGTLDPPSPLAGHYAPGSGAMTVIVDDDINWFFGVDSNPADDPPALAAMDDLQTTILHEVGHVLGLGHFGTYDRGYIMAEIDMAGNTGRPNRAGLGGVNHVIDADAIHGIRDLYAIAVPEPSCGLMLAVGFVLWPRYRRRS